jgi:hypothetical protein
MWNVSVEGTPLSKAREFTNGREQKCRARLKDRDLNEWETVFSLCAANPFLCGQNDRFWKADFDWIIKNNEGAAKILEGKYSSLPGMLNDKQKRPNPFEGVQL